MAGKRSPYEDGRSPVGREPVVPRPEPGNRPEPEPGHAPAPPDPDRPPARREGTVSNPDY